MNFDRKIFRTDFPNCSLCYEAGCNVCESFDVSKILRSIWFDNERGASLKLTETNPCLKCKNKKCVKGCINKIDIPSVINKLYDVKKETKNFKGIDYSCLKTDLCGIKMDNPFLLSSSCVGGNYEMIAKAFKMGWAGVSFKTICLMKIHEASPRFDVIKDDLNTFREFKNIEQLSQNSFEENIESIKRLKKDFPKKIILASIMGSTLKEWKILAENLEKAGADALELNLSCPNMIYEGTGSDAGQDENLIKKIVLEVKKVVKIPVLAKLTPNVVSMIPAAQAALEGGADGIVAINTIKSLMTPKHGKETQVAVGGLSGRAVKPISLHFLSEITSKFKGVYLSAIGGIETWRDALEYISIGANTVQLTTSVMEYGYRIIDDLKEGLALFLNANNLTIKNIKGIALKHIVDIEKIERDVVIYPRFLLEKCKKCLRCYLSCYDGGHQAISFNKDKVPILNPNKCVGCHLCVLVCPHNAIISSGVKVPRKKLYNL